MNKKKREEKGLKEEKEFAEVQRTKLWMCRSDSPYRLAKHGLLVKISFLAIIVLVIVLLFNEKGTFIRQGDRWDIIKNRFASGGEVKAEYKIQAIWFVLLTMAALSFVQGSNPGYLDIQKEDFKFVNDKNKNKTKDSPEFKEVDLDLELNEPVEKPVFDELEQLLASDIEDNDSIESDFESDFDDNKDLEDAFDLDPCEQRDYRLSGIHPNLLPIRSRYCKQAKRVVSKYDHFCAIINTPIGERNHLRFLFFLMIISVDLLYALAIAFSGFHDTKAETLIWFSCNAHALILTSILMILNIMFVGLFLFHVFLMITNSTTYEFMRHHKLSYLKGFNDFDLPFSNGIFTNTKTFCLQDGIFFLFSKQQWQPKVYSISQFDRDSNDIINNIWENKYYSCC